MKKPLLIYHYNRVLALYKKLEQRLIKNFSTGRFKELNRHKQFKLLRRLEKLKLQLSRFENKLKYGSLALATTAGFGLTATESLAQTLPVGPEFRVNTHTTGAQMSAKTAKDSDGDFVVTWTSRGQDDASEYGIYAQRYNAQGIPQGEEFRVNTYTPGRQNAPAIAMDDEGNFVIVWTSNGQDGDLGGIFGQRFNAAGQPLGSEFRVNTHTTGNQYAPSVAMDSDGDFVVTWAGANPIDPSYGIYARCYNAAGEAKAGEIHVNTYTTGVQRFPTVAMDNDGDFVVAWQSEHDGSSYGIYGQRFNANGVPQGEEFRVNSFTTGQQKNPFAAMDEDGDFVIAWQGSAQDGNSDGIFAQRYNTNGVPEGNEFRVNTFTTGAQTNPSVAMNNNEFVISWTSSTNLEENDNGVYAQRFNAAGIPQGDEFRVNTYTTNSQSLSSVAIDNDNDFIIAWTSVGQDGSNNGVYAQRFESNKAPSDIVLSSNTVNENSLPNTTIGTFTTVDVNLNNTFTYTLVEGVGDTDNDAFVISDDALQIKESPDFESKDSYSIRVRSTDQGGLTFDKVFSITIKDVNEAPLDITITSATIAENVTENTEIGTFITTDADAGDEFTYTLVDGSGSEDNSAFVIVGNSLKIIESPDFETKNSYSIRVRSTDKEGLFFEKFFTITIENVEETGISDWNSFSSSIQLYPNPAKDKVMVNLQGSTTVRILDVSGNVIKHHQIDRQIIPIDGLNAGVYILEFTQDGKTGMKKLVIE
jgi:hypothetical protein